MRIMEEITAAKHVEFIILVICRDKMTIRLAIWFDELQCPPHVIFQREMVKAEKH